MVRYGMVINLERCMGCRACMEACKVENNTPQGIFWMHVFRFEKGEYPTTRIWFAPRPCMHCNRPPCVQVCPVGATYKDDKGRVMQDPERCIGCRYCMQACPYGVRYFNDKDPRKNYYLDWESSIANELKPITRDVVPPYKNPDLEKQYSTGFVYVGLLRRVEGKALLAGGGHLKGVVEKCTFCLQRVERGLLPACVANCPVNALIFGDLDDPNSEVSQLLAKKPHFRLLEDMGTHPNVYYVGQMPPDEDTRTIEPIIAEGSGKEVDG
ncbi:MAG: 4Fe-4S dicluster domain-containing protein [Candidatus Methanofastidiosia archaeon]